jgi:hypothetical protein
MSAQGETFAPPLIDAADSLDHANGSSGSVPSDSLADSVAASSDGREMFDDAAESATQYEHREDDITGMLFAYSLN